MHMRCCIFFCKQKTAYEMRISDWSSDVCSSDLASSTAVVAVPFFSTTANQNSPLPVSRFSQRSSEASPAERRKPCTAASGEPTRGPFFSYFRGSGEHTSELQSLMRISYAVFCLQKTHQPRDTQTHDLPEHHNPAGQQSSDGGYWMRA